MDKKLKDRYKICKHSKCKAKFKVNLNYPLSPVCSYNCAIGYANESRKAKASKNRLEFNKSDPKWLNKKIGETVQEISRIIDYHQKCLAVPTESRCFDGVTKFDGGHVFSKGGTAQAKWNLHNIHRQNSGSNRKGSDDYLMILGLEREYGIEYKEFVDSLKGTPLPKFMPFELSEIYGRARKIRNALKKNMVKYSKESRIQLRNEVNKELGIYPDEFSQFQFIISSKSK